MVRIWKGDALVQKFVHQPKYLRLALEVGCRVESNHVTGVRHVHLGALLVEDGRESHSLLGNLRRFDKDTSQTYRDADISLGLFDRHQPLNVP
jgi:hypothetical protein